MLLSTTTMRNFTRVLSSQPTRCIALSHQAIHISRATRPRPLSLPSLYTAATQFKRFNSSLAIPESQQSQEQVPKPREPSYQITFTCKPCQHRSSHTLSKHGYHKGTTLIQCPNCKVRHVISDHLKIFMDKKSTLEDILRETAGTDQDITRLLKKGTLGQRQGQMVGNEDEADIEFWDDGTQTRHEPAHKP